MRAPSLVRDSKDSRIRQGTCRFADLSAAWYDEQAFEIIRPSLLVQRNLLKIESDEEVNFGCKRPAELPIVQGICPIQCLHVAYGR